MNSYFLHSRVSGDRCAYSPHRVWSLTVIILYTIVPFVWMLVNYLRIWKIAATFSRKDKQMAKTGALIASRDVETLHLMSVEERGTSVIGDDSSSRTRALTINSADSRSQRFSIASGTSGLVPKEGIFPPYAREISVEQQMVTTPKTSSKQGPMNSKATRTTSLLIFVYICCWGPLGIYYMVDQICDKCLWRAGRLWDIVNRPTIRKLLFRYFIDILNTPVSQTRANPPQANPQAKEVPKSTCPSKR